MGLARHQGVVNERRQMARALRQASTEAEAVLWQALRGRKLGAKFRRQQPAHGFILDFYCASARVVIELDGSAHDGPGQTAYDIERSQALVSLGLEVLRFENEQVLMNLEAVLMKVREAVATSPPMPRQARHVGLLPLPLPPT